MPLATGPAGSNLSPTSTHTIGLQVDRIDDLFQSFDPAPMNRRALSAEVDAFVLDQIEVHSPPEEVSLRIVLPESEAACCDAVQSAFRDHFARATIRKQEALRRHFAVGQRMLGSAIVVALILVLLSQVIAEVSDIAIVQKIANGISIVVWVTLWRPIEFMIYDWRAMDRQMKTYRRLSKARVQCVVDAGNAG